MPLACGLTKERHEGLSATSAARTSRARSLLRTVIPRERVGRTRALRLPTQQTAHEEGSGLSCPRHHFRPPSACPSPASLARYSQQEIFLCLLLPSSVVRKSISCRAYRPS